MTRQETVLSAWSTFPIIPGVWDYFCVSRHLQGVRGRVMDGRRYDSGRLVASVQSNCSLRLL